MTDNETGPERLGVQKLYRDHEPLVEGAAGRLMPAVRLRLHRRRTVQRAGSAAVAVAVLAVLGGVAISLSTGHTPGRGPTVTVGQPSPTPTGAGTTVAPTGAPTSIPQGPPWTENLLGVQIQVPFDWLGGGGCPRDTQVRDPANPVLCRGPRGSQDFIYIGRTGTAPSTLIGDGSSKLVEHPVRINGVPAVRAEGAIAGGQYGGSIIISSRNVEVVGRTGSQATLTAILDSLKVAPSTDANGCPLTAPTSKPPASGLSTFVDPHPTAISVCQYNGLPTLLSSTLRTADEGATSIASFLNGTKKGVGLFRHCAPGSYPTGIDALILVTSGSGKVRQVDLWNQACLPRRLNNGDSDHTVSIDVLNQVYDGMNVAYSNTYPDPNVDKSSTFRP